MSNFRSRRLVGLTLLELIVVISVIGVLVSLLLPAIQAARGTARRLACSNNFRQVAIAMLMHHDTRKQFPPGTDQFGGRHNSQGWPAKLLPFLEEQPRYSSIELAFSASNNPFDVTTHPQLSQPMPIFGCVEDPRTLQTEISRIHQIPVGSMAMQGNSGTNGLSEDGVLYYNSRTRLADITDGTSQTLLFGERPPSFGVDYGWWYAGVGAYGGILDHHIGTNETMRTNYGICNDKEMYFRQGALHNECSVSHFWSMHPGGAHFAYADGSVHFLSYGISNTLRKLATRAGNDAASTVD